MKEYKIYMDGDHWCAVNDEFIDLQESISGFGSNPLIALKILIEQENLGGKLLGDDYFGNKLSL